MVFDTFASFSRHKWWFHLFESTLLDCERRDDQCNGHLSPCYIRPQRHGIQVARVRTRWAPHWSYEPLVNFQVGVAMAEKHGGTHRKKYCNGEKTATNWRRCRATSLVHLDELTICLHFATDSAPGARFPSLRAALSAMDGRCRPWGCHMLINSNDWGVAPSSNQTPSLQDLLLEDILKLQDTVDQLPMGARTSPAQGGWLASSWNRTELSAGAAGDPWVPFHQQITSSNGGFHHQLWFHMV